MSRMSKVRRAFKRRVIVRAMTCPCTIEYPEPEGLDDRPCHNCRTAGEHASNCYRCIAYGNEYLTVKRAS